jgi:hypothetical protein
VPSHRSVNRLPVNGIGTALPNGVMLPAGYLLKRTLSPPGWLAPSRNCLTEVCSVSDCVNENKIDVQGSWKHNEFGVASSLKDLVTSREASNEDLSESKLFYYTAYELELESDGWEFDQGSWRARSALPSAIVTDDVETPPNGYDLSLLGYDVVVLNDYLEHSPLSCNGKCDVLQVNKHCLIDSLSVAVTAINEGAFGGGCEPGKYTVFGVHLVTSHFETT